MSRPVPLAALSLCLPTLLVAQQSMTGFAPARVARELAVESLLVSVPDAASLQRNMRELAREPHVAGTPRQLETATYVLREMARWGLDTSRVEFEVYLPFPDSSVVELRTPVRRRLGLLEPGLDADPTTRAARPWPAVNGYSANGDVTAPVVFVNYGLPSDYATLDSMGVSVRGKVAVARYGRSFRGIKAREAERRGAVALLIYSDPQEDGFARGDVYPRGPMRAAQAIQRGSVFNGQGDPSTPGWGSVPGARRLPLDSMAVPRIPVVPIGYANAQAVLEGLGGPVVPSAWQGGLPFAYHVGGGDEVTLRVAVIGEQFPRGLKRIANTLGTIRGAEFPDEVIVVGGHRDAWSPGATDNVSGTITVMEAARAWAAAVRAGHRPRRTLVFATWDAEEWGLVGSSEHAEHLADELRRTVVAYVNLDVAATGRTFGGSASASLQPLLREVAAAVRQPGDTLSVLAAWKKQPGNFNADEPRIGDLGGGSDFAGFYNHLGIPAMGFGFGGPGGVYHAAYDTWTFLERFADPGYVAHVAASQLAVVVLARLANADVLPLDYGTFGRYLVPHVDRLEAEARKLGMTIGFDDLRQALQRLAASGDALARRRDSALGAGTPAPAAANARLRVTEHELARPAGLAGRPFQRNLVFASDRDNGYATIALPGIAEALRDRDEARARREVEELAARVRAAATRVDEAAAALGGP